MRISLFLVLALVLSGLWLLITGEISLSGLITGITIGVLILLITGTGRKRELFPLSEFLRRWIYAILFFLILLPYHIVVSNLDMMRRLTRRVPRIHPGIIRVPVEDMQGPAIGLEETAITMEPGTMVVDYSDDRKMVYLHLIDVSDFDEKKLNIILWMHGIIRRIFS